jgi:hypothetical protein
MPGLRFPLTLLKYLLAGVLLLETGTLCNGQDRVRLSSTNWRQYASERRGPGVQEGSGEAGENQLLKFGEMTIAVFGGVNFEYNSNINTSEFDPFADFIVSPHIKLDYSWAMTRYNSVRFTLGLSYNKYLINTDYDESVPLIDPDTILEFNLYSGDFKFTLYDIPEVTQDQSGDPTLNNTANFTQFNNALGLTIQCDLNKLVLTLNLERADTRSLNSNFEGLDSTTYRATGTAMFELTPTFFVGIQGSVVQQNYLDSVLNNSVTSSIGILIENRLSTHTSISAGLSVVSMVFSNAADTPVTEQTDPNAFDQPQTNVTVNTGGGDFVGVAGSLSITNELNRYFIHSFGIAKNVQPSSSSNYVELYSADYSATWRANRFTDVRLLLSCIYGITSGQGGETFQMATADLEAKFDIFRDWSFLARLGYIGRTSNRSGSSYGQSRVIIGFDYRF